MIVLDGMQPLFRQVPPEQIALDERDSCASTDGGFRCNQARGSRADDQQVVAAARDWVLPRRQRRHSQPPVNPARFRPVRMGEEFRINFQIRPDR